MSVSYYERDDARQDVGDDDYPHNDATWLRDQLDRELVGLTSRPDALREVLAVARFERPMPRGGGLAAWAAAAAAVIVVALAVPVLYTMLGHRDAARPTAAAGAPPLPLPTPPVLPSFVPTSQVTRTPTRTPPVIVVSPTHRPSATHPPTTTPTTTPTRSSTCSSTKSNDRKAVALVVDGDARPDALRLVDGVLTVDLTGSGTASIPFTTSSPYVQVLPVEADGRPDSELLLLTRGAAPDESFGMQGVLYGARGCSLAPVLNVRGQPYKFDVGSSATDAARDGVACRDGVLLGVTSGHNADGSWSVTRTPVSSASGTAVNGTPVTSKLLADDPAADTLATAACGIATPLSLA